MHISNMKSANGKPISNQFAVSDNGVRYFQSYSSLCAKYDGQVLTLGRHWDYSTTTSKYLHKWLECECHALLQELRRKYGNTIRHCLEKAIANGDVVYDEDMI